MVRRYLGGYIEGDTVAAFEPYWHPEVSWHTDPRMPEPGVDQGAEAIRTDLDGEEVLAVVTLTGHPLAATERETQFLDWSLILTLKEGKVFRIRSFLDKAEALKAAGLSE